MIFLCFLVAGGAGQAPRIRREQRPNNPTVPLIRSVVNK